MVTLQIPLSLNSLSESITGTPVCSLYGGRRYGRSRVVTQEKAAVVMRYRAVLHCTWYYTLPENPAVAIDMSTN